MGREINYVHKHSNTSKLWFDFLKHASGFGIEKSDFGGDYFVTCINLVL